MQTRSRPGSVVLLATLEVITGAVFLLGGTALLTFASGGSATLIAFGTVHLPIGVSFLIIGVASLISASRWVRTLGLAVAVVSIVDDLVAFAFVPLPYEGEIGTGVVLLTALIVVYLLAREDVRSFFAPQVRSSTGSGVSSPERPSAR